jgi:sugar/nucleoside kinase (ribokinase family)
MGKQYDVLAAGNYCLDLIFTGMTGFLELGREVFSNGFEMIPGEAYNSVVAMHRLGLKVGWAADFGSDEFSSFALEKIRLEGLDETLFVHHKHPLRRISIAASYPEDRAFLTYYDPEPRVPAVLKALALTSAHIFYLPGLYSGPLFNAGLALVRAKGMQFVMDGNSGVEARLEDPAVRKAVSSVDLLLPNAREAKHLAGEEDLEKAMCVLSKLCPLVVVKDGPNGACAWSQSEIVHSPALGVKVVDTTGAGDCFNAGFIRAWRDGLPIEKCLQWGNIVGGLSTTARGGTGRVVCMDDIRYWSQDNP